MKTLAYFFSLAKLVFLYDVTSCDVIKVENLHEILIYFLKFSLRPCLQQRVDTPKIFDATTW